MTARNPVFCALDTTEAGAAAVLAQSLAGLVGGIKLGLEFFIANGPDGVRAVAEGGPPLFLDLKLHDIPNTVAGAMRALVPLAPLMTTVHAGGGRDMLKAAAQAAAESAVRHGVPRPQVLAVTVLTSFDQPGLEACGVAGTVLDQVRRLAALAQDSGVDGVVCSPHEVATLRAQCGPDFTLVVPGIRPAWSAAGDQRRIMTPADALAQGANWLVIGRPITGDPDPVLAARRIAQELGIEP
ncbi:MAG: orotidine-5'-phosphate decarboxylase [Alphaproteobacteria bacterium]|nr:orotidine-5'-phosphate decarboxylase [Alphaproteobacteria bacterium]